MWVPKALEKEKDKQNSSTLPDRTADEEARQERLAAVKEKAKSLMQASELELA